MINKVILLGRVGSEPKVYGESTKISLATSKRWKNKQGEKQESTQWHNVVFFGKVADIATQYIKKGNLIYVEGEIETSKYTDQSGIEKYSTSILVGFGGTLQLLGSKDNNAAVGSQHEAPKNQQTNDEDFDDDIAF